MSHLATVHKLYEAFAHGDVARAMAFFDDHIEWHEAESFLYADRNPYMGPQAIVAGVFLRFASEWDDFRVVPQHFHDAGEVVLVEGRYIGTYRATGRQIYAQFAHVYTFRNGVVVRFQQYTDTAQFKEAATMAARVHLAS
jgi:ketosteroid isomerase-like protein